MASCPKLEAELKQAERRAGRRRNRARRGPHAEGRGRRRGHRQDREQVDRHSRVAHARRRSEEAGADGAAAARARGRAGRGADGGRQCHSPFARGPERSQAADRFVHFSRTDGRGQDGDRARAGRVPVRRRAGHGAHRHERVHGEARGGAADRRASGIRRLRRRRPVDRGRAAPAVRGDSVRRDREGAPGCLQRAAAGDGRRAPDRLEGPHGGLQEHGADHDLEPGRGDARAATR